MLSSNVVAELIPTEIASCAHILSTSQHTPRTGVAITRNDTHLADSKMAETADELLFVEGVGRLLHTADDRHLLVPLQQVLL